MTRVKILPRRKHMKNLGRWLAIACLFTVAANAFGAASGDLRLIEAVKKTDVKAVRSLIALHVDVNAVEVDGSTALHWAAQRDNAEIVDLLITAGASAKAQTR